jgi:hypothetical protein
MARTHTAPKTRVQKRYSLCYRDRRARRQKSRKRVDMINGGVRHPRTLGLARGEGQIGEVGERIDSKDVA